MAIVQATMTVLASATWWLPVAIPPVAPQQRARIMGLPDGPALLETRRSRREGRALRDRAAVDGGVHLTARKRHRLRCSGGPIAMGRPRRPLRVPQGIVNRAGFNGCRADLLCDGAGVVAHGG